MAESTQDYDLTPLAAITALRVMETDDSLSERTENTRIISAQKCLIGLASGEWNLQTGNDRLIIGEFLGRVIANANRQGIIIPDQI